VLITIKARPKEAQVRGHWGGKVDEAGENGPPFWLLIKTLAAHMLAATAKQSKVGNTAFMANNRVETF